MSNLWMLVGWVREGDHISIGIASNSRNMSNGWIVIWWMKKKLQHKHWFILSMVQKKLQVMCCFWIKIPFGFAIGNFHKEMYHFKVVNERNHTNNKEKRSFDKPLKGDQPGLQEKHLFFYKLIITVLKPKPKPITFTYSVKVS